MKIAVIGARPPGMNRTTEIYGEFLKQNALYRKILHAVELFIDTLPEGTTIVSGNAQGVDTVAKLGAGRRGFPYEGYSPEYNKFPAGIAPLKRNETIVLASDIVHAFPAPWSTGTHHATTFARSIYKDVVIHNYADL